MDAEPKRRSLAWLWGIVPAVVIAELVLQWRIPAQVPTSADWTAAAAAVRAEKRPDDLVVIAPDWATQGRMYLGDALPIPDFGRFDAARYGRILEVSLNGARAPETAGLAPETEKDLGRIAVRAYRNPDRLAVLYDLSAQAARAEVEGGGRVRARLVIDHWFQPRFAVPIALPAGGKATRVTFPDVPLDGILRVYAVIGYREGRFDKGLPVKLAVFAGGRRVIAREVANFSPIEPTDVPLRGTGAGPVTFEASTGNIPGREFSIGGYVYRDDGRGR